MGIHERKEREKEHRREEILNAAQKTFFEKGLQSATMDEIAEAAELSKGTLYLYYSSKEDLYLAVMMRGFDLLREMMVETINKYSPTVKTIWELARTYLDFSKKHTNYFRMFHFFQNPSLHRQVSEDMMAQCNTRTGQLWSVFVEVFQKGIDEGVIRPDLNPMECAVIMWSSSDAILTRMDFEHERWKEQLNVDLTRVFFRSNALLLQSMLTEKAGKQYSSVLESDSIPQFS